MRKLVVSGLFIHPVKSMRAISLQQATLTARGLLHDRRWMVVRPNGRFVTQRDAATLALIDCELEDDGAVLRREGHGSVRIPFEGRPGEAVATEVWGDPCRAVDEGPEVSRWLTEAVGSAEALRIVRMAPGFRRRQSQPERFGEDTTTLFADSAPLLLASETSLAALNDELQAGGHDPVPMNRFRPNIVLRGLEPFEEHRSAMLSGSSWSLRLAQRCERCVVTTIDQETARPDPAREPYMTLRRINPVPGPSAGPAFGQHAILDTGEGRSITVGEAVTVTAAAGGAEA
jgi:uncharacterized protein YcbX